MSTRDVVLKAIAQVAQRLGPDLEHVVFVGGTVAALYELSELDIRPTDDVDVITQASLPEYYALRERLKARGFRDCRDEGAPLCRVVCEPGIKVDLMATDPTVMGFSNRWYEAALADARTYELPDGNRVRAITPLYFVATKLEAFNGRGQGDFASSHDLEDLVSLLGRMPTLLGSIDADPSEAARWAIGQLRALAANDAFIDTVPGYFLGDEQGQEVATVVTHALLELRER